MSLLAFLLLGVMSTYIFVARNLERLMTTQKQDVRGRRALRQFTLDASAATAFTYTANATTTNLTFTVPSAITLANCTMTSGSATVTCTSTSGLTAGLAIVGTGVQPSATVSSVTNATTLLMSATASSSGTGRTISAATTSTVSYVYDTSTSNASFSRIANGITTLLLDSINTGATTPANGFAFYDQNGNSMASSSPLVKQVEFSFTTYAGTATSGTQSSYVLVSPRVILRNKPLL